MQEPVNMPAHDAIEHIELPVIVKGVRSERGEMVEVELVAGGRYQVFTPPALVEGLAVGDIFELNQAQLGGFKVTYHSGNLTIWMFLPEGSTYNASERELLDKAFSDIGGVFEGCAMERILIFSVHVTAMFDQIEKVMAGLMEKYPGANWQYANVYDWDDAPLNWWVDKSAGGKEAPDHIDFNEFELK